MPGSPTDSRKQRAQNVGFFALGALVVAGVVAAAQYFSGSENDTDGEHCSARSSSPTGTATRNYRIDHNQPTSPASHDVTAQPPGSSTAVAEEAECAVVCSICMSRPCNMLFNECGHLSMCESCVLQMSRSGLHDTRTNADRELIARCPLCRQVGTLQKVYLP